MMADVNSHSDFPSLSGGRPQMNNGFAGGWNSNAIRQPSAQHQQQSSQGPIQQQRTPSAAPSHQSMDQFDGQRSQQPSGDRGAGGDEFPPLSGQSTSESVRPPGDFNNTMSSPHQMHSQSNGQQTQLPIRDGSNAFQQGRSTSAQSASTGQAPQSAPNPAVKKWAAMTEQERWGLAGLAAKLEARRQMDIGGEVDDTLPQEMRSAALLMGHDLNTLDMNLDSPDPIYPTFSPFPGLAGTGGLFDGRDRPPIPDFWLPPAYTVNNVPPVETRMSAFSDG